MKDSSSQATPFDSTSKDYRALIFGASGITGWAIMNSALACPSPNTFELIVGLTHRPLSAADSQLPQDPRIELYSGINLSKRDTVIEKLKQVREIEKITHVYFAAYTSHGSNFQELKRANVKILANAVEAVEALCPKLAFFTLQTGGKVHQTSQPPPPSTHNPKKHLTNSFQPQAYGIEFADKIPLKVPSKETDPSIPAPYASNIFYYSQHDHLLAAYASNPGSSARSDPT